MDNLLSGEAREAEPAAGLVLLLAAACGMVVANIYYAQPLLGLIGPAVGLSARADSVIMTVTQLGYAAGLLLLVPLGDLLENRRLVVVTIALSIPALLAAALAGSGAVFLRAAAATGVTAVAVQMLVPLAAHLAPDATRGRVVGNVMSGLLLGIMLARPLASIVTDLFGWRAVFFGAAAAMAVLAAGLRLALPARRPEGRPRLGHYLPLLGSMLALPFNTKLLRYRMTYQAAAFSTFITFWNAAPMLLAHEFHCSQRGIALFALVGAAGALAAPVAGRLADRDLGRPGTVVALLSIALAFALAFGAAALHSVVVLAAAAVALDTGVQSNLVFSQRALYALAPEMRSRLNGVFMASFFSAAALASAVTSLIYASAGFGGICVFGAALPALALLVFWRRDHG